MGLSQGINGQQAQPGVCTSTSRPPSPFLGQIIFETDTNLLKVYETDGWSVGTQLSPWNIAPQPSAPTVTPSSNQVALSWTIGSSAEPITDYKIYFSTSVGGTYTLFADGVSTATSATVTSLTNGTQYFFKVSAVNAAGESALSVASTGVTPSNTTPSVQYLVIAGGGGGGGNNGGGGGGAGGYRSSVTGELSGGGASAESVFTITPATAYTVTVGGGGVGRGGTNAQGGNGQNSVFATITSTGGGGGGDGDSGTSSGLTGGSGGGGSTTGASVYGAGAGTAGQGYAGGTGSTDNASYRNGGAGGGAGAVGQSTSGNSFLATGGAGRASSITGTSVTRGGGGGGGGFNLSGGVSGAGGAGGGGGVNSATGAGTPNTGGGGVGDSISNYTNSGGSGVVILRYSDSFPLASATTGSPTVTNPTGFRVYTFTGSGSITF